MRRAQPEAHLVVIGNFDGVHRGHQALLDAATKDAAAHGLKPRLLTFRPHPAEVLGRTPPPVLTRPARKRELIERLFPAIEVVEQRFDPAFASLTPDAFAAWLATEQNAKRVVVGQNFRFGKGRAGGFEDLVRLGAANGFTASSHEVVGDEAGGWSSTRIRGAIAAGDLEGAERMLGRPHMLIGEVVAGKRLGRTIGFPTANLNGIVEMLPPFGVYATLVDREDESGARAIGLGAMSIGTNPTTDTTDGVKVEVFVLDFEGDLYGERLRVSVVSRLRGEAKYGTLDALVAQMGRDVAEARRILEPRKVLPELGSYA
ncbi:MAG: riboflavin biosynthesis protein RibF [Polyangiaceae bacterium]|nr:riboflavin biosynthesis protein RibF [Polyangiaceae bacterium]